MDLKMATMVLAGSVLVHAAVTACTSTSAPTASAQTTPPSGTPASVEVSAEACDKTYEIDTPGQAGPSTQTVLYAEHAYPGKSKEEIAAHVTHWTVVDDPNKVLRPPVYNGGLNLQSAVYTRDGFAGAGCPPGKTSYFIWSP